MNIEYRNMKSEEAKETIKLARRSFPFYYCLFIHSFKDSVVAVDSEKIVGGAAWHIIETRKGSFGYLDFGFTEKNYRGHGIGRETYTRVMTHFNELDCDASGAIVLCDNTASWRLLADNGCSRSRATGLIRRFGFWGTLKIWFESAFVFSPGAEFWCTGEDESKGSSSAANILLFLLVNFGLSVLTAFRQGRGLDLYTASFVIILLSFRLITSRIIAGKSETPLHFSFWRSGWMLPFFVFLSGGLFPLGGDFYPSEHKWNYLSFKKRAGLLGLGSWLAIILSAAFMLYVKYFKADLIPVFEGLSQWIYMLLIFHAVPVLMESWPGNRVIKWNKIIFTILFLISAVILFLMFLN